MKKKESNAENVDIIYLECDSPEIRQSFSLNLTKNNYANTFSAVTHTAIIYFRILIKTLFQNFTHKADYSISSTSSFPTLDTGTWLTHPEVHIYLGLITMTRIVLLKIVMEVLLMMVIIKT